MGIETPQEVSSTMKMVHKACNSSYSMKRSSTGRRTSTILLTRTVSRCNNRMTKSNPMFWFCCYVVVLLLVATPPVVDGAKNNEAIAVSDFENYWTDAAQVLRDLDNYQALWIKTHRCVWSECAVDDNDDDGENRDGDEQWYLYRTQQFCANVAFTLYGIPKHSLSINHCSRSNYINSFFTYGGSDTLLYSLGKSPQSLYYDDDGYTTNADCTILQQDDDSGLSSTMGCTKDGDFAMATFANQACDGNGFVETIDSMRSYNRQLRNVGCSKIWGRNSGNNDTAVALLSNSWACDLDLYPKGCPDPYGMKQRMSNALRAVSHGQNPKWAIWNGRLKRPLRFISWIWFLIALFLIPFTYRIQNRERILHHGGGISGMVYCVADDYEKMQLRKELQRVRSRELSSKRKKKKKKKKHHQQQQSEGEEDYEEHGQRLEEAEGRHTDKHHRKKKKRSSSSKKHRRSSKSRQRSRSKSRSRSQSRTRYGEEDENIGGSGSDGRQRQRRRNNDDDYDIEMTTTSRSNDASRSSGYMT